VVFSLKDLQKIIEHFDNYPFITQKHGDYLLFREAVLLILKKEHLTLAGLEKIVAIKASMNLGLSKKLEQAFPNIIPTLQFLPLPAPPSPAPPTPQNAPQGPEDSHHRRQGPGRQGSRREEGGWQEDGRSLRRQEEAHQDQEGDLLLLHLQGPQAGPPRHWYLQPCHEHPELVRQRHFRARRHRGLQARCLQQEVDHLITRDPDLSPTDPAW
jgi:hypothetical protein